MTTTSPLTQNILAGLSIAQQLDRLEHHLNSVVSAAGAASNINGMVLKAALERKIVGTEITVIHYATMNAEQKLNVLKEAYKAVHAELLKNMEPTTAIGAHMKYGSKDAVNWRSNASFLYNLNSTFSLASVGLDDPA